MVFLNPPHLAPAKSTPHPGPLSGPGGEGRRFKPATEPPCCWRDWAAKSDSPSSVAVLRWVDITGGELLAFVSNEETTLPNGMRLESVSDQRPADSCQPA